MNIKPLLVTVLTLIATISSGICQVNNTKDKAIISENYFQGVYEVNVAKNSLKAAAVFAKILKIDSTHSPSHYMLSRLLSSKKESLQHSINAHKYDSTNIWYQIDLTNKYMTNKMYDDAIALAEEMLKDNPDNLDAYSNLVTIHSRKGNLDNAEKVIDNFESKFGATDESFLYRVQLYQDFPASDTLILKLENLIKSYPTNAIPLIILGEKYFDLNKDDLAHDYYKRAEKIDSTNAKLIILLTDYYLKHRDIENLMIYIKKTYPLKQLPIESKVAFIEEVLFSSFFYEKYFFKVDNLVHTLYANYPNSLLANNMVAQHYINTRSLDKAAAQYLSIIEKGIANDDTYYSIIGIKSYQKHFDSVIVYCDKMIEIFPETEITNSMQKSYAYMSMKQFDKAISTINNKIPKAKDKVTLSEMYGMIGDIYYEWGKTKESYTNYKKALRYNPDNIQVLNNYSYHLSVENKQLKKASEMIEKVIKREPENSTYLDTYGWILYQMGNYELAEIILKKAVANDTTNSEVILMHYGDVLYKLERVVSAKVYWLKAKEKGADKKEITERLNR